MSSQVPMYPPQQHDVVGPDSQGTAARKVTRPWLAYLQSLTTNVVNSVTHTGALVLNRLIVGNGGQDIRAEALTDGQIPIGATSDGTVQPATITAGANISIVNSAHGITIGATGVMTGPAGANTDIQYNNSGAFGGDANLTWDKTNGIETVTGTGQASPVVVKNAAGGALAAQPGNAGENLFLLGMVQNPAGDDIPTSTSAAYLNQIAATTEIDIEIQEGLTAGVAVPFTNGVGLGVTGKLGVNPASVEAYQYGGLGTGAVPGMALLADRNDSGSGATGIVGGQRRDGQFFVFWVDHTGVPRFNVGASLAAIRPTEDNSVSDTSGSLFGTGTGISQAQVSARVLWGV